MIEIHEDKTCLINGKPSYYAVGSPDSRGNRYLGTIFWKDGWVFQCKSGRNIRFETLAEAKDEALKG